MWDLTFVNVIRMPTAACVRILILALALMARCLHPVVIMASASVQISAPVLVVDSEINVRTISPVMVKCTRILTLRIKHAPNTALAYPMAPLPPVAMESVFNPALVSARIRG